MALLVGGISACGGSFSTPIDDVATLNCSTEIIYDTGGTNGYGYEQAVNIDTINTPTDIAFIPDSNNAFLVTSQDGSVYYFKAGCDPVNSLLLDDVGVTVITGGEQGLLNIEFHPDYTDNGYVFFYHTSVASNTNSVSRVSLSFDGDGKMFLSNAVKIIDFSKIDNASNHNGGGLVFTSDGSLLASVGDGGGCGGGSSNGQLNTTLTGSVIRILPSLDDAAGGYTIPVSGNMFNSNNTQCSGVTTSPTPCPEILAMGLRNPFRMSISGNIVFLGDVGADVEEIDSFDYTTVDGSTPVNFGWDTHDGFTNNSAIAGYHNPIIYYSRNDSTANAFRMEDPQGNATGSASIMIGDIYTGSRYGGALNNKLLFAEFYDGFMRAVGVNGSGDITDTDAVPGMHIVHHGQISSMIQGPDDYIYFTSLYFPSMVYRLVKP